MSKPDETRRIICGPIRSGKTEAMKRRSQLTKTPPVRPKSNTLKPSLRARLMASTYHTSVFSSELKEWLMWDRMGVSFQ